MLRLKVSLMESFFEFVVFLTYALSVDSVPPVLDEATRVRFIPGFT